MARQNPYSGDDFDQKIFTIPVTGGVRLWGPELDVVSCPEFQRLAGIKQLGTADAVFRGAVHTRFEHSLGALHEAERLIRALQNNPATTVEVTARAHQLARMAALLHDVTHIPFGHSLEDEFRLLMRHDENSARRQRLLYDSSIGQTLEARLGSDWFAEFQAVVETTEDAAVADLPHPFVSDIVGNTVCADMLDYVPRDLRACGMPVSIGDRFLDFFTITPEAALAKKDRQRMALNLDKRGMPRPDVESEVIKLLSHRYELVERVYFHHAKNSASVMLARAVSEAGIGTGASDAHFDGLSDEMLLLAIEDARIARALGVKLERRTRAQRTLATELAQRVRHRALYKIGYLGVHDDLADQADALWEAYKDPAARLALEDKLADAAGLSPGQVLAHVPPPKMLLKLAEVRVLTHRRRVVTLEEWDRLHSGRATALNDAHRRLWRMAMYIHPEASDDQRRLVCAASEDEFGVPSRYVKPARSGAYLREVFDQHSGRYGWTSEDWRFVEEQAALDFGYGPDDAVAALRALIGLREELA